MSSSSYIKFCGGKGETFLCPWRRMIFFFVARFFYRRIFHLFYFRRKKKQPTTPSKTWCLFTRVYHRLSNVKLFRFLILHNLQVRRSFPIYVRVVVSFAIFIDFGKVFLRMCDSRKVTSDLWAASRIPPGNRKNEIKWKVGSMCVQQLRGGKMLAYVI